MSIMGKEPLRPDDGRTRLRKERVFAYLIRTNFKESALVREVADALGITFTDAFIRGVRELAKQVLPEPKG